MKCLKGIKIILRRCSNEIRKVNFKLAIILSAIFLLIGIFVWSFGRDVHKFISIFIFPKFAMPLIIMYLLWAISYIIMGITIYAIMFTCESYKKPIAQKITFLLCMSIMFSYFAYLLFFSANAPAMSCIMLFISFLFTIISFIESKKIYIVWSFLIFTYSVWLFYNMIIPLSFLIIN